MSKTKLFPIAGSGNRVFVDPIAEAVYQSSGGILITKAVNRTTNEGHTIDDTRPNQGIVFAVSEEDNNGVKPKVKVGDKILYSPFSGQTQKFEDKEFLVLKEVDIQAIIQYV